MDKIVGKVSNINKMIIPTLNPTGNVSGKLNTNGGQPVNDYNRLSNKPKINFIELIGNHTLDELDIQETNTYATNSDIDLIFK